MSTSLATHLTATDLHSPVLKPRILVIDDDVDMGDLLYRNLPLQYRCHVDVAADPFEAINMMTERFYDLIVLDWNMPAFDGGEILKKTSQSMAYEPFLPAQWDHQDVPVIVFSSEAKADCLLKRTKHFNYVGYISKAQPIQKTLSLMAKFIDKIVHPKISMNTL